MNKENKNNDLDFFDNGGYEEEVNFGQVLKTSHRTFGLFYLFVVVGIVIAGLAFLDNQSWVGMNKYDDSYVLPVYEQEPIAEKKAMTLSGVDVYQAAVFSDEAVLRGKEVYVEYCTSCHGENGNGDGLAGAALNPPPRNFHDSEGWTNGSKISDIYKTLEEGILANGMSAYDYLPVEDRFALAHFIRSMVPDPPIDSESDLQNLDLAYSLSEGKKTNNQISVDKAMRIISEESAAYSLIVSSAIQRTNNVVDSETKRILETAFSDKGVAFRTLVRNSAWRESLLAFEAMIRSDFGRNGFGSSYNTLSTQDRMQLHAMLRYYLSEPQSILSDDVNSNMMSSESLEIDQQTIDTEILD